MKPTIKAKILSVSNETQSITTKQTTRKVVLTVVEHLDNPFGHTPKDINQFDVEVYNHNIENFNLGPNLVGEVGVMELMMTPSGPGNQFRCIVNDLSFRL